MSAPRGERLRDAEPYPRPVFVEGDPVALDLVLCRWSTPAALTVSLPEDSSEPERALLQRALGAWNEALPELHLVESGAESSAVALHFTQSAQNREGEESAGALAEDAERRTSALAAVDCALETEPRLARARVNLDRHNWDALGRPVALAPEELLGAVLHELGHALGFQGHAALGPSVMVKNVDAVRRTGRRVAEGSELEAPTLAALYTAPAGISVGRLEIPASARPLLRRLAERARREGWQGPLARVGDRSARIFWRDAAGDEPGLLVLDWPRARRDPEQLFFLPNVAARAWLFGPER